MAQVYGRTLWIIAHISRLFNTFPYIFPQNPIQESKSWGKCRQNWTVFRWTKLWFL